MADATQRDLLWDNDPFALKKSDAYWAGVANSLYTNMQKRGVKPDEFKQANYPDLKITYADWLKSKAK